MRPTTSRRRRPVTATRPLVRPLADELEPRRLMAAETVNAALPNVFAHTSSPTTDTIDLLTGATDAAGDTGQPYFLDTDAPGTIVTFETNKGNIVVALDDPETPVSVANFLSYVNSGAYNGTIIHRSAYFDGVTSTGVGGSAANPANIIQGGGYTATASGVSPITTTTPIENYESGSESNVADTIALANTGADDSASSQWFFNNVDNSSSFDGNYTAFGHVLEGADVVSLISSLPTNYTTATTGVTDVITTSDGASLNQVPLTGLTASQITGGTAVNLSNLIYIEDVVAQAGTSFTATSSDPTLVTPTVTDGKLSLAYGSGGATGTANVTVTATNAYDGTTATESFAVTVPPASSTATAPITAPDTVAAAVQGVAATIDPLANDTDATVALNPSTLTVVTAPAHADTLSPSATVPGELIYTPAANYTGTDTFQYTVADADGVVSAPTTVTVNVVLPPSVVTIGHGTRLGSILFTEPDGTRGHAAVSGGSAVVTFSAGDTTLTAKGNTEVVTGAGATISNVVVTDSAARPSLSVATLGKGSVTVGGLSDVGNLQTVNLRNATLGGTVQLGGSVTFAVGDLSHATVVIGAAAGDTDLLVTRAVDSSVSAGVINHLTSQSWTNDDSGSYAVDAEDLLQLNVRGMFADALNLSGETGYGLLKATVGGAAAPWAVNASVFKAVVTAPTSDWALSVGSLIATLDVRGNLESAITASTITTLNVTGGLSNASVETDGLFNQLDTQLDHLTIGGAVTDSVIFIAGNVNTISARSLSGSRVYAGVQTSVAQASGLPAATTDLAQEATINRFTLRAGKTTFANSELAAYVIRHAAIGTVTVDNSGTAFGVSAHTLGSLAATLSTGRHLNLSGAPLASATALSAFLTKEKVTLSDFNITLY